MMSVRPDDLVTGLYINERIVSALSEIRVLGPRNSPQNKMLRPVIVGLVMSQTSPADRFTLVIHEQHPLHRIWVILCSGLLQTHF